MKKRFLFTEEENKIILESIKRVGEDWEAISEILPGRTPKQIRDRFMNYLRDGLVNTPWTKEEDEIVLQMFKEIGPKWSKMKAKLPGRSGNDIKNRWHKHLVRRVLQDIAKTNYSILSKPEYDFNNSISQDNASSSQGNISPVKNDEFNSHKNNSHSKKTSNSRNKIQKVTKKQKIKKHSEKKTKKEIKVKPSNQPKVHEIVQILPKQEDILVQNKITLKPLSVNLGNTSTFNDSQDNCNHTYQIVDNDKNESHDSSEDDFSISFDPNDCFDSSNNLYPNLNDSNNLFSTSFDNDFDIGCLLGDFKSQETDFSWI